ncbi:phage antirepressor KilAC domain-containing protein [Bifidobacterium aquikefiri]|uniref:phage antirepressor KilAC domain-containing protein n=1 Tax=Bifidobacterium aquikefiri TaxID=1653207 RepID=UPI0039EB4781
MTNTSISNFAFKGANVRAFEDADGKPLFCAKDVAEALGYKNTNDAISAHCKGVVNRYPLETAGGIQQMTFIGEGDLYRLIASSKLPAAQEFESWIFDEVIPSIRRHGAYMSAEVIERTLTSPDYLIRLATQLKQEQELRKEAETRSVRQAARIDALEPKAQALDDFTSTKHSYSLADAAKILANGGRRIGQRVLVSYLLEIGWVFRSEGRLHPYQDRVDGGFLESRAYPTRVFNGKSKTFTPQTRVTTKGLASIWRKLYGKGITAADLEKAA